MKLLGILLISIQLLHAWAVSPPGPVGPPSMRGYLPCNHSLATFTADVAVGEINKARKEGYVYSLFRIISVLEDFQQPFHHVYYLTLDVLETECHVLSKRFWKECPVRPMHAAVYGTCEAIVYINKPGRIVRLYHQNCTLQPVPRSPVSRMCPDCPTPISINDDKVVQSANQVLKKYNSESGHSKYFALLEVTKASMQWVVGPSYFVEFLIGETSCANSHAETDTSKCSPLTCSHALKGLCKGSVMSTAVEEHISASCEIFNENATHHGPHDCSHDDHKPMLLPAFPDQAVGSEQAEHKPATRPHKHEDHKPMPLPAFPDQAVGSGRQDHGSASVPLLPATHVESQHVRHGPPMFGGEPHILPFPHGPSESDECPGEPSQNMPLVLSLLPHKKPVQEEKDDTHPLEEVQAAT